MIFFFYQLLNFFLIIFSPIIIIYRLLINKEHPKRFLEKFSITNEKRNHKGVIWFHGSSVGEILSVIPLIKLLEKNKKIKKILVTSQTLSSSNIFEKFKFKKTFHQFFPIDVSLLTKKFLKIWSPKIAIFIESEIWPSMFFHLKSKKIPLLLLNARITSKSYSRWRLLNNFALKVFSSIDFAYPQNKESLNFLKLLKVKKIKFFGNLKYSFDENKKEYKEIKLLNQFKNRKVWCASSTHNTEETLCAQAHKKLRSRFKNLITIIIPRHVDRISDIEKNLSKLRLNIVRHSSNEKITNKTDIYLVDTYGETKKFLKISKAVFIGGSMINHGGQNPLEAARYGIPVIFGPYIQNFTEVYNLVEKIGAGQKVLNLTQILKKLTFFLTKKKKIKTIKKLKILGNKILNEYYSEIVKLHDNENKKTNILGSKKT